MGGRALAVGGAVLAAYLAALVATAPAQALRWLGPLPGVVAYGGTVWAGEALLAGGHAARWRVDWPGSLGALGARVAWRVQGPGTALTGRLALAPGAVRLEGVTGRAGWGLVAALAPGLGIACDPVARVDLGVVVLWPRAARGAEGRIDTQAGQCRGPGGAAPVPALAAVARRDADAARLVVTEAGAAAALAEASLSPQGRLVAGLTEAGAALVPGLRGAIGIELDL